ncbi:IS110 family transposase [Falsigemmobacter intermedius]
MKEITTIGLDLAKSVFQLHGVDADGAVVLRRQLRRAQMLVFFSRLPPCLIGMEACGGAHHWARELSKLGHEVRLIPPSYVKPFVRRGKTDSADAEAICTAVVQPSMRFVPVKTPEQQAVLMQHRVRDFLVRQQTQLANAIRAHLGEFGIVVAKGVHHIGKLLGEAAGAALPEPVITSLDLLARQFMDTQARIDEVTRQIREAAERNEQARLLQTMPGIGPITASAIVAHIADTSAFRTSRDLSAWLGLTPKPHSSGGKHRVGSISKMGNRYLRRLLYLGAMGVISARRKAGEQNDWLGRILATKPAKVAAVALANRMARTIWAMLRTGEVWRPV